MSTDLTLVHAAISFGSRTQKQPPIIRLLQGQREPRVARVRVQTDREQVQLVASSANPRHLKSKQMEFSKDDRGEREESLGF